MTYAYDKNYLSRAQNLLAVMFDFAVYDLHYSLPSFYTLFLFSKISTLMESGDTATLGGKSGVELASEVINDSTKADLYQPSFERSPEYWTGWALAYFQWYTKLSFVRINSIIPITEIYELYNPYHEMDISQLCDFLTSLYNKRKSATNLKSKRMAAELSQSELAKITEIPIRTIQQYEQRQKNINVANTETVLRLSKALSCPIEDLLELN